MSATMRIWAEISAGRGVSGLPRPVSPIPGSPLLPRHGRGARPWPGAGGREAAGTDLSAGDFVRWCRQVIDLLDQVRNVAAPELAATAKAALTGLRRGVVALGAV